MRNKGTFNFASNFEVLTKAPLDARLVVDTKANLIDPNIWEDDDTNIWLYKGITVSVVADPSINNNGLYFLENDASYQSYNGWSKIGQSSSLDASVIYNQQVNVSQDASIDTIKTNIDILETSVGTYVDIINITIANILSNLANQLSFNSTTNSYQAVQDVSIATLENTKINSLVDISTLSNDYTLITSDNNKILEFDTSTIVTFPDSLDRGFQIRIVNISISDYLTLDASTLLTKDSSTKVQYGDDIFAYHKGSGEWRVLGNVYDI